MVLYTPIPPELIWGTEPSETEAFHEIEHQGVTLVIQPLSMNTGKIVQVKSTDPNVFLKQEYQPGRVISFIPSLDLHNNR